MFPLLIGTGLDATEIDRIAESIIRGALRGQGSRDEGARHGAVTSVFWTGSEVVRRHGPPSLVFHGGAGARFQAMGATRSLLTLTHSKDLAIAHVC